MKNKVIIHAVESFEGGVFHSIVNICHSLSDDYNFVILHGWRPKTPANFTSYFPHDTIFVPWDVTQTLSPGKNFKSLQQLKQVVSKYQPIRIHAHSSTAGVLSRLAFISRPYFVIYSPRCFAFLRQDIPKPVRNAYKLIEWMAGRTPHYIAACGYDEHAHVCRTGRKSVCIPNTVDLKLIDDQANSIHKPVITTVVGSGRILPQKNFAMFVRIAKMCQAGGIRFVWIGDGDVEKALNGANLPDNLQITGWLSHSESLKTMASAHMFLHTALWEGLSRTCLEAAALSLPLLLRPVDGARELVKEQGKTGFLCNNEEDFVEKITLLTDDTQLQQQIGKQARLLVEKAYNSEQSNLLWKDIYLNGKPSGVSR